MKKTVAILSGILLLVGIGFAYILTENLHLSDLSAGVQTTQTDPEEKDAVSGQQDVQETTETSSAEQNVMDAAALIRQGGPYEKIINTGQITIQVNHWELTDRVEDYPIAGKEYCGGAMPEENTDYRIEVDYVDWDAVYKEKPRMREYNEDPDSLSIDEQISIMHDAAEVEEKYTHYKKVYYDYLFVECTVKNLLGKEYEFWVNDQYYVIPSITTPGFWEEPIYFDKSQYPGTDQLYFYTMKPGEELNYTIGFPVLEEDLAQASSIFFGMPELILGTDEEYDDPLRQTDRMIEFQVR